MWGPVILIPYLRFGRFYGIGLIVAAKWITADINPQLAMEGADNNEPYQH